jgi:subtilisin-like proprotein convertase family protein
MMLGLVVQAPAQTNNYSQSVNAAIPDGNPTGISSVIQVSGVSGFVSSITVGLNISGGANGDLYAYITHLNDTAAVLLNRVGRTADDAFGYTDAGFTIYLNDLAQFDIHTYGGNGGAPLSGTWQPDGRLVDPQLVLDTSPRTALLSGLNGQSPNGNWTLFIADFAGGQQSTLQSWSLEITSVPEPAAGSILLAACLLSPFFTLLRARRKRQPCRYSE